MKINLFSDISKNDVSLVGGKAASLGEMTNAGIPVPPGFVITTQAFENFNGDSIAPELQNEIEKNFSRLGAERVAVRSSAVAEDSSSSSFAGQFETFLNVTSENLIRSVINCLKSASSQMVTSYASAQGVSENDLKIAVVVQKMVNSEVSGVLFTANPINKDRNEIMIEAIYGLGELLVQGMTTPDNYLVDKVSGNIKSKNIARKDKMIIYQNGKNEEVSVPEKKKNESTLTNDQIIELTELGVKIESHYGVPQDIEWGIESDKIYILQSRPITTI
ncbi:MAG: hypothetical protein UW73_C0038G0007 [Microgenomates group bacterium GW2011_GWB1_44_8]|nr:MAG: hypothetical protein UW73_C0038G0007 [Microgenomates group bacterium GW2011_GWB1_44_8]